MAAALCLSACSTPQDRSPCVYVHDFLTDADKLNAHKRTCQEMYDEANARIVVLQAEVNAHSSENAEPNTLTVQRPETFSESIDEQPAQN